MIDCNHLIRKLAKCNYYQTIYSQEKNLGIRLFNNEANLTYAQIIFLNYLAFYSALYFDFSAGEVDERVFDSEIREDAYMYFRKQNKSKARDRTEKPIKLPNKKEGQKVTTQWVFKTPKRVK
ncbi:hypothetical protein LCGC14_2739890 [marine sediment metagenome]|uniref:Uncharacterized protein n=1 Tax=marine sediment metagenome TaxID=412755 RepID=A0A0F8Z4N5_9ZZZZ